MIELALLVGVLIAFTLWIYILKHWQHGFYGLLIYLPFAGVITLALYPSPLPTLFKDIFFVIPAYLSFAVSREIKEACTSFPKIVSGAMLILAVLVVVQMFNQAVPNWMVAAIGAKVWLFYLPITFMAFVMIKSREGLVKTLRLMVVIACIPCTIGILQWIGSMSYGYQATMEAVYGEAARGATQNFASFDVGGIFYRIPSTFTFVAQYFGYTLAMIVPAYALMRIDSSPVWRRFATFTLGFVILASFLSGARAAFVFVPLLLTLIYLFDGRALGVLNLAIFVPIPLLGALYISEIDPTLLYDMMFELTTGYAAEIGYQGLVDSLNTSPVGLGTGMNTGPARYAFYDPESFSPFENYYAKAVYELGILGLFTVVAVFMSLIGHGYNVHRQIHDKQLRSVSAAILAFIITMALNSFKGWVIDLDPINVYFWMFAGFLFQLKHIASPSQGYAVASGVDLPIRVAS